MRRRLQGLAVAAAFWLACFTATFGSSAALAADIFADAASGHDFFGDGSAGAPFKSLTRAMSAALPGDRVVLRPGLYSDSSTGEVFPVVMRPTVSIAGSGTTSTVVATEGEPALWFVYGNFDSSTRVEGFTMRQLTGSAYDVGPGVVIDGASYGGYVTSMSPVIASTVIEGFYSGIEIDTDGQAYFPVDASPSIENNIIRDSYHASVDIDIAAGDTSAPSIQGNLLQSASQYAGFFADSVGIDAYAEGGGGTVAGAMLQATIKNNVLDYGYWGVRLAAGGGDNPARPPQGLTDELPFTTGGTIEATVSNNIIRPGFQVDGIGIEVHAITDGKPYGGVVSLNASRNTINAQTGIELEAYETEEPYQGGYVSAALHGNEIVQTEAFDDDGTGVHAEADAQAAMWLELSGNQIRATTGVHLRADAPAYGNYSAIESTGGRIDATLAGNVIDSLATGNTDDSTALEVDAGGAGYFGNSAPIYGTGSGGRVDLQVRDNVLKGEYGAELDADAAGYDYVVDGGGGTIDATLERNWIVGIERNNDGNGLDADAEGAFYTGDGQTGGTIELALVNNVVRGYDGLDFYQGYSFTADGAGNLMASVINNTIIGGGTGSGYPDGHAIELAGYGAHPTIVNNILQNTSSSDGPVVVDENMPLNNPAEFDNNLLFPADGAPLTVMAGATQSDIDAVNALAFADANLNDKPGFTCPSDDRFSLREGSPAIDAASALFSPADDFTGSARPFGEGPDIGAFEFLGSSGPIFVDVPLGHMFYEFISAIAEAGITAGCSATPLLYCPDDVVSREQMAVFLIRALADQPDSAGAPLFADVVPAQYSFGYVQRLAQLGITSGCAPGLYCPLDPVTRAQMAVFLLRALGESPVACSEVFSDVTAANPYCGYIERLAELEITSGCGAGVYCPDAPVTRGQMAAFLARAFNLMLPVSCDGVDPQHIAGKQELFPEGSLGVDLSADALARSRGDHEAVAAPVPASDALRSVHASGAVAVVPFAAAPVRAGSPAGAVGRVGPVANELLALDAPVRAATAKPTGSAARPTAGPKAKETSKRLSSAERAAARTARRAAWRAGIGKLWPTRSSKPAGSGSEASDSSAGGRTR